MGDVIVDFIVLTAVNVAAVEELDVAGFVVVGK